MSNADKQEVVVDPWKLEMQADITNHQKKIPEGLKAAASVDKDKGWEEVDNGNALHPKPLYLPFLFDHVHI